MVEVEEFLAVSRFSTGEHTTATKAPVGKQGVLLE